MFQYYRKNHLRVYKKNGYKRNTKNKFYDQIGQLFNSNNTLFSDIDPICFWNLLQTDFININVCFLFLLFLFCINNKWLIEIFTM